MFDVNASFIDSDVVAGSAAGLTYYSNVIDISSGIDTDEGPGDLGINADSLIVSSAVQTAVLAANAAALAVGDNDTETKRNVVFTMLSTNTDPGTGNITTGDKGEEVVATIPVLDTPPAASPPAAKFLTKFRTGIYKVPIGVFSGRWYQVRVVIPPKVSAKLHCAFAKGKEFHQYVPRRDKVVI